MIDEDVDTTERLIGASRARATSSHRLAVCRMASALRPTFAFLRRAPSQASASAPALRESRHSCRPSPRSLRDQGDLSGPITTLHSVLPRYHEVTQMRRSRIPPQPTQSGDACFLTLIRLPSPEFVFYVGILQKDSIS